jgi:PAS domain S-box-containing protein
MARRFSSTPVVELSPRESQLLEYAKNGLTDQAIANELGISLATIATYWGRIRIKFGPLSRTEIVAKHLESQKNESLDLLRNEVQSLKQQLHARDAASSELVLGCYHHKEAILILDLEQYILFANETACRWMGRSYEELVGKQMLEFWPEDRRQNWLEHHKAFKLNPYQESLTTDVLSVTRLPDGGVKSSIVNMTPYETPDGLRIFAVARMEA